MGYCWIEREKRAAARSVIATRNLLCTILQLSSSAGYCAGIRYIQENDYPVRGTWGLA